MRRVLLAIIVTLAGMAALRTASPAPAAATTIFVTNTLDSGDGSLRAAMLGANLNPGRDTIAFAITTGGPVKTITLASQLPVITDNVIIDGTTQSGTTCTPRDLRVRVVAGVDISYGFIVSTTGDAPGTEIRGIETGGSFTAMDVRFNTGTGHSLTCSNIGTGENGTVDDSKSSYGVFVNTADTTIGGPTPGDGNVVSGHFTGIAAQSSINTTIQGNIVGLDITATVKIPNSVYGMLIWGTTGTVIDGNNIGGNGGTGIELVPFVHAPDPDVPVSNAGIYRNTIVSDRAGSRAIKVGTGTTTTTVRENSLITREGQALDLAVATDSPRGYTPNGPGAGPNGGIDTPILTSATAGTPGQIIGDLTDLAPATAFTIDLYRSRTCNDLTRNAETHLGSIVATTDGSGSASFDVSLGSLVAGDLVTATVTDPAGSTSELSPVIVATGLPGPADLRIVPCERTAGWEAFTIRAFASSFNSSVTPTITYDGVSLPTTFISSTEIQATVPAELLGIFKADGVTVDVLENSTATNTYTPVGFLVPRSSSDVDCDGAAGLLDVLRVRRLVALIATPSSLCFASADRVGSSSTPDAADALWILREIAGLIPDPLYSLTP